MEWNQAVASGDVAIGDRIKGRPIMKGAKFGAADISGQNRFTCNLGSLERQIASRRLARIRHPRALRNSSGGRHRCAPASC